MKTALQAAGLLLISILVIIFCFNQFGRAVSDTELENSLDNAMEHALYVTMSKTQYSIEDQDQLAADVIHELMTSCNVDADYTISFHAIDMEKGLLDICVKQSVNGSNLIGSDVECRKTLILEHAEE